VESKRAKVTEGEIKMVVSRAGSGEEGKDWDDLGQKIILNENICY
jgi:hypothetical protein